MFVCKMKLKVLLLLFWCFMLIIHLLPFLVWIDDSRYVEGFYGYLTIHRYTSTLLIALIVYQITRILKKNSFEQNTFDKTILIFNTAFNMLYLTLIINSYVKVIRSYSGWNPNYINDIKPYLMILMIIYSIGLLFNLILNGLVFRLAYKSSRNEKIDARVHIKIGFNHFSVLVEKLTQIIVLYSFLLTYALLLVRLLNFYLDEI